MYQECFEEVERRLPGSTDARALAVLNLFKCRSQIALGNLVAAVKSGGEAAVQARVSGDGELAAVSYYYAATAAIEAGQTALAHHYLGIYFTAPSERHDLSANARFNLGVLNRRQDRYRDAVEQFDHALRLAVMHQLKDSFVNRCRRNLVWCYIELGMLDKADVLLRECEEYVQGHDEDTAARVHLEVDRSHWLYANQQLPQAFRQSEAALRLAQRHHFPNLAAQAAVLAYRATLEQGLRHEAMALAVVAKFHAIQAQDRELDAEIGQLLRQAARGSESLSLALLEYLEGKSKDDMVGLPGDLDWLDETETGG